MSAQAVVLYAPVVHKGYLEFLCDHPDIPVYVLGEDITHEYREIVKDIRALSSSQIARILSGLLHGRTVHVLKSSLDCERVAKKYKYILMPDETISRAVSQSFFTNCVVDYSSVFLRWESSNVSQEHLVASAIPVSTSELAQNLLKDATQASIYSADWWRQVGAILVCEDGSEFRAINEHMPHEQTPYVMGDARASSHKGVDISITTAMHAENRLIAEAARAGKSTQNAKLFVTTFPCPWCARTIIISGIAEIYFVQGYTMLGTEELFVQFGVSYFQVQM